MVIRVHRNHPNDDGFGLDIGTFTWGRDTVTVKSETAARGWERRALLLLQFLNGWRDGPWAAAPRREMRVWPEIIDGVRLNCSRRTVKLPGILHPLTIFRTLNRARRLSFNYSCPRPRSIKLRRRT